MAALAAVECDLGIRSFLEIEVVSRTQRRLAKSYDGPLYSRAFPRFVDFIHPKTHHSIQINLRCNHLSENDLSQERSYNSGLAPA
jgi:hypothetical protein